MLVLPAIDLKEGKCVRLYQGEMGTARRGSIGWSQAIHWRDQRQQHGL